MADKEKDVCALVRQNHALGVRLGLGENCGGNLEMCVRVLVAILLGMGNEMRNPDAMYLALHQAKDMASSLGVSDEEFKRVSEVFCTYWYNRHSNNPFSDQMFGVSDYFKKRNQ